MSPLSGIVRGRLGLTAAFRSGFCMLVPLLVLYALGALDLSAYVTLAAFTSLYGRNEPYRRRATTVGIAGLALVIVIAIASMAAAFDWPEAGRLIVLFGITAGGVVLSSVMRWIPYGPIFHVFAFSVCALVPTIPQQVVPRVGLAVAAAAFSWLVSMSGWIVRRWKPGVCAPNVTRSTKRELRDLADPVVYGVALETTAAVAVALWIASLTPLGHGYWAAVTVVAILPRPYAPHVFMRIFHRVLGTAVGVALTGVFVALQPSPLTVILTIGTCQFGAEIFVPRIYGVGLLFITPAALLMNRLTPSGTSSHLLTDRLFETLIGGVVTATLVGAAKFAELRGASDKIREP